MTQIGSIQNIQSNIIAYESLAEYGFCREYSAAIDNSGTAVELGTLVYDLAGVWTPLTNAQVTSTAAVDASGNDLSGEKFGVLIGFGAQGEAIAPEGTTATEKGLLIIQGVAILRKEYIKAGTTNDTAKNKTIIEANTTLINVDDSQAEFTGTYSNY